MVSSAVLLTVLVSTMSVVSFASTTSGRASMRDRAVNIAGSVIERARNMRFDQVGVRYAGGGYGEPPGEILTPDSASYPGFTVTTSIAWVKSGGRTAYKEMKVTVSWQGAVAGDVALETGIFGATDLVNVGDLKVTVLDRDSGAPILGALVTVDPYETAPPRMLNAGGGGVADFGRVDQGPASVVVSAAGFAFDNTITTAVPINKDLATELVVYGYRSSTLTVTVRDPAGPVGGAAVSLTDPKGKVVTASTDASGNAVVFAELLPGTYWLDASAGNRKAGQSSVEILRGGLDLTCDVMLPAVLPAGQLRIIVRDATTLKALSGATLALADAQGGTPSGSPTATVAGQTSWGSLVPGVYRVSAAMTGYTPIVGAVATVVSGQPNTYTLDLVPVTVSTGTLRAIVNDQAGRAVRRRTVYLRYPDGRQDSARTDASGLVEWNGLPVGSYTLWISTHPEAPQSATPGTPYTALTFVDS